jgi:hypothetical protein
LSGSLDVSLQSDPHVVSRHVQAPLWQSGVGCAQFAWLAQVPVLSQSCGVDAPSQRVCPGTHPVTHSPWSHASGHIVVCQVPVLSQTSCAVPLGEHWAIPGTQAPVHEPFTHAYMHWLLNCHAPLALHVWVSVPLHCIVPGVHAPEHTPASHW